MSVALKVIHVTSAHPRDDVRIKVKFANYWADRCPSELIVCDGLPDETKDNVRITGLIKRKSRLLRALLGPFDCLRELRRKKDHCVVHLHDPELLLAAKFMRLAGYTVIFDLHEDLIDQVISKPYMTRRVAMVTHFLARFIYPLLLRTANVHIAATHAISAAYERRLGRKVLTVYNYVMQAETRAPGSYSPDSKQLVYTGAINEIRGIYRMLDIAEALPEDWRLVLAGRFRVEALKTRAMQHPGWKRVDYRGQLSRDQVREIYAQSAAGLVLFDKQPNHMESLPNKMFEYMGNALPCIATDIPQWQKLVEGNGVGICVPDNDDATMLRMIHSYLEDGERREQHALNGATLVHEKFTWEPQFDAYAELVRSLQSAKS